MLCGTQVPAKYWHINKQHHITHAVGWLPKYTNTTTYNTGSNKHT